MLTRDEMYKRVHYITIYTKLYVYNVKKHNHLKYILFYSTHEEFLGILLVADIDPWGSQQDVHTCSIHSSTYDHIQSTQTLT